MVVLFIMTHFGIHFIVMDITVPIQVSTAPITVAGTGHGIHGEGLTMDMVTAMATATATVTVDMAIIPGIMDPTVAGAAILPIGILINIDMDTGIRGEQMAQLPVAVD